MLGTDEYYGLHECFWIKTKNGDDDLDSRLLAECMTVKGLRLSVAKALARGVLPHDLRVTQYALEFSKPSEFDDIISSMSYEEWIVENPKN